MTATLPPVDPARRFDGASPVSGGPTADGWAARQSVVSRGLETKKAIVREFGWLNPPAQMARVLKAAAFLRVEWPSGRVTTETLAGGVVVTERELAHAYTSERLLEAKRENMLRSFAEFTARVSALATKGWLVRPKKRGKHRARRIAGAEWA